MTERATKTLIGAFVLAALALATVVVLLVGSGTLGGKKTTEFVLFFDASLRGLVQGSPVYFKGVPVGKVASIHLSTDKSDFAFRAPVIIELDNALISGEFLAQDGEHHSLMSDDKVVEELIRQGLRAKLGVQSFITGQLTVDLDIDPSATPVNPASLPRYRGIQQIPTEPSSLDAVLNVFSQIPLKEIATDLQHVLAGLNQQIAGMDLPALSASLTRTSDTVEREIAAFGTMRGQLAATLIHVDTLIQNANTGLNPVLSGANRTLASIDELSLSSRQTIDGVNSLLREDSAFMLEFSQTMRAIRDVASTISELAALLELQPNAVIFGRGK